MAINFTQTDTNITISGGKTTCGGDIVSFGDAYNKVAEDGATAGSTAVSVAFGSGTITQGRPYIGCNVASGVSWNSGTWTWRINVTTSNMNLTITSVYICHVDSAFNNIATIGSSTGLSVSLSSTGVKSGTVSGSAISPSAGDKVLVCFNIQNTSMSIQSFQFTPNQNIDSPFTAQTRTPRPTSVGHPFIC